MHIFVYFWKKDKPKIGCGEYLNRKDRDISEASLSIFLIVLTFEPLKYFTYSKIKGIKM